MFRFYSISEAVNLLGVCAKTLRWWDCVRLFLPAYRTSSNHRLYALPQIKMLCGTALKTPRKYPQTAFPIRAIT
ncbi:MAG: MerR family transcriptional regulator [Promethearchaeota archaeon]